MPQTIPEAADVVAKAILEQSPPHRMSAMKLQKLVYYCECWSLAWDDRSLFSEPIEAWREGPVVRSLWEKTNRAYETSVDDIDADTSTLDALAQKTIRSVLGFYGQRTDGELGDLIEVEEPWRSARGPNPSNAQITAVIDRDLMKSYYRTFPRDAGVAV